MFIAYDPQTLKGTSMKLTRRTTLVALTLALSATAIAQTPSGKTLRIIVPFPPGQGADTIMRMVAEKLGPRMGQSVIVENRPGAGGTLGMEYATTQPNDGSTLLMAASGPMAISPTLQPKAVRYNPLKDYEPITGVASVAQVFVVPVNSPYKTLAEFITAAKAKPEAVTYGSSGNGTTQHLFVEAFADRVGIKMLHVPYKGGAPALIDLLGGQIAMMSDTIPAMLPQIKGGKVRPLGVTSGKRSPYLPDVPTIAEQGVRGFEAEGWITIVAPAGAPASVTDRLDREIRAVLAEPDLSQKIKDMGFVEMTQSREPLRAFFGSELAKWKKVIDTAGIKVE